MPREVDYYFHHVHARSAPTRDHKSLVSVCAVCHSDPRVREQFALSDTTASYLASFHGKAMLLGSEETAGCLDCHTTRAGVHDMLAHADPRSPTDREQLATTCRSARCHPGAGQFVSSAAVHLDLSQSRGIEYFIAILFVVLILFTFGPSVLITALELLQIVVGRHDPEHARDRRTAEVLLRIPQGRLALRRFTLHQRFQHWSLAVLFTALVVTGFPIKFADRTWADWAAGALGGVSNARLVHRWAGVLLILGFVYHMIYIVITAWHTKRRTGKGLWRLIMDLPMVMNAKDLRDLAHLLGFLLFLRKTRPAGDRFSLKEKFEYFGVFWGCCLLGVTGVLMWANAWTTQYLPGRALTVATLIHTFEAFLALIHVGVIHMIGVILSPAVFPLSRAMFTGDTPVDELAEAHAGFVRDADRYLDRGEAFGV
jgi:cytochrome b subunit of formate dehydrogenase